MALLGASALVCMFASGTTGAALPKSPTQFSSDILLNAVFLNGSKLSQKIHLEANYDTGNQLTEETANGTTVSSLVVSGKGVPNGECTSATYISSAQFCEVSCLDGKGCKPSQVQPPPPSAGCGCLPANIFAPLAYARAGASCTGMNGKAGQSWTYAAASPPINVSFCFDGDVPLYLEEDLHPKAAEFLFNDPSPSARHVLSAVLMSHEESLPDTMAGPPTPPPPSSNDDDPAADFSSVRLDFSGFKAGAPPASAFVLPSICKCNQA